MSEKTMTHVDTPLGPSTQRALDAVRDLHAAGQIATREAVSELTGDRLSVVDDRLRVLADDKFIRRLARGAYMPMEQHPPPRVISKTLLPDGTVKYEIGDEVLTLTPAEDRALSSLSAGAATQAAAIQTGMATAELVDDLRAKHRVRRRKALDPFRPRPRRPAARYIRCSGPAALPAPQLFHTHCNAT